MSTFSSNESRLGSSWLQFLKLSLPPKKTPRLSLVQCVSAWAAENPNAPAIATATETLFYAELEAQSNALARHLQSLGATRETLIALVIERSPEFAIAALAAWKAGAAYLPLDPSSPPERIRLILEDARAPILIRSGAASHIEVSQKTTKQVDISDRYALLRGYSSAPLPISYQPSELAYVIYTSGSTGRPKGVEITHSNLLNLVHWHQSAFAVSSSDRATMLASPGFDAAVWEIWPYLSAGASLRVPPETTRVSPRSLRDWMLAQRITVSFVPTPIAQRLISLEWPTETSLRFLLTGADVLQQYPPDGLPFTLVNNYGPTECTVVALSGAVTPNQRPAALPPVGRPISNTQIFLLDEELQQVPAGSIGELHIAGAGVGRGYLNDPELTREKFIPNPFDKSADARLYRTGDLARALPDGSFEFLGRTDDQIKIRGYRIEPNEVCAALCKHDAIQSGIVVPIKDLSGNHFLAAYMVLKPGAEVSATNLRKHLQSQLPDYMIPNAFVVLDSFPFTTNGKVDRAALPTPDSTNSLKNGHISSGPTRTEEMLMPIVSALLKVAPVNPRDNFFLLGGHSLLGAQLLGEIQQMFQIDLPLRSVFDYPTISTISAEIDRVLALGKHTIEEPAGINYGHQHDLRPSAP
ncbi:MAG: Peptide synthetase [Candidatus Acidoferrum typicum]|nr:Peptide synthetase [Candidatus Acidoferrum typicum]